MRVLSYVDLAGPLKRSGIATAVDHHRKALADQPVEVLTDGVTADRLGRIVTGRRPDVDLIHTHLFGPGSIALRALARRTDVPMVCHAHVTREDFRGSFRGSNLLAEPLGWYLRRWYDAGDLVLAPSAYTRDVLRSYPVEAPIAVVSNGVDLASLRGFEDLRGPYRDRYDLSGTVVFAVGNVFERKGLSTFCRVAERRPDLEFVWFGRYDTGPLASPEVRRWTRDPPANVTFTGWIDDKRGAFGAGDIFFFPTHEENQGIVVLEAMACGRPVVLRDIPVVDEYTTDGDDCLRASDLDGFVTAIDRLADDPTLAERVGERARERAMAHRLEAVGEDLHRVYRRVVGAHATETT
ncbi:MAG: glycosyltransferase family 4 protein [Halobacteriales archaeon]